jgi:hypothetical protein
LEWLLVKEMGPTKPYEEARQTDSIAGGAIAYVQRSKIHHKSARI